MNRTLIAGLALAAMLTASGCSRYAYSVKADDYRGLHTETYRGRSCGYGGDFYGRRHSHYGYRPYRYGLGHHFGHGRYGRGRRY